MNLKIHALLIPTFLLTIGNLFAEEPKPSNQSCGWSFDLGGSYTWMSFSHNPATSGSTGGALAKITYQKPWEAFGQVRSFYNQGSLSNHFNHPTLREWYTEIVGGYCFPLLKNWSITPYLGLGIDFLHENYSHYYKAPSITLNYDIYYAIAGFDTHYTWNNWMLGLQADCLPSFNEYLNIKQLPGIAWTLSNRTGLAVRLPVAYRFVKSYWLELTPYYRKIATGSSNTIYIPGRTLNQWGVFLTFRFFL